MSLDFVYLASGSPRRRELLEQIGVAFRLVMPEVDETVLSGELPPAYVARLAAAKAQAGWERTQASGGATGARLRTVGREDGAGVPVLAADTAVVLDGRIFGKPVDRDDAERMLSQLSGRTHEVLTAVALRGVDGVQSRLSRSEVSFRAISAAEARRYWDSGEPRDKAGAYAIQGRAAIFIAALLGSYSGVMGLPLYETAELLEAAGVPCWQAAAGLQ